MIPLRRTLALALIALVSACGHFLPEPDDLGGERRELAAARTRWEAARPADYTYVIQRTCQVCTLGPVTVTVRGGAFQSAIIETGDPAPAGYLGGLRTVDEVFATLGQALDGNPHELEARYDATLGYPLQVTADPVRNSIDEEWGLQITRLTPLGS